MHKASDHPEPALQATALRYAAGDLSPGEAAVFECRLAADQDARDALSEAVRLSAACLGQAPPEPHASFRAAIRERLRGWCPEWLARRAYRGHPATWAAAGASVVVACGLVGVSLAERKPAPAPAAAAPPAVAAAVAPEPRPVPPPDADPPPRDAEPPAVAVSAPAAACGGEAGPSVAELWAQMSTPEHVEKAHDDEMRWRQRYAGSALFPVRPPATGDAREP